MKALLVEAHKTPREVEIDPGLESLQKTVGGYIEALYPFDDPVGIVCDEEGKINGKSLNRALRDEDGEVYDILAGDFLIVGVGEEDYIDLSDDLLKKYNEYFKYPEAFERIDGKIVVRQEGRALEYSVGDRVYIDNKPYEIVQINAWYVEIVDRTLRNPPRWAVNKGWLADKENFEQLVWKDLRNSWMAGASDNVERTLPEHHRSEYRLLDRLKQDCEYFLGNGNRAEKQLWAGSVIAQISKMRALYATVPEKPEWLTEADIDSYESRMKPRYEVVVYHHIENGFDERLDYQTLDEAKKIALRYVDGTMEDDGFRYDGAAVYDLQEKLHVFITGSFPDEKAWAQLAQYQAQETAPPGAQGIHP